MCSLNFSEASALNVSGRSLGVSCFLLQEGGCSVPVAVNTMLKDGQVRSTLYLSGIISENLFQCMHVP